MKKGNNMTDEKIERLLRSDLSLEDQREILKDQSYSPAFPGSAEARSADRYEAALKVFDSAHPEILEEIKVGEAKKRTETKIEVARLIERGI